jgi:Tfp pilus assembly protein PilF
VAGDLRKNSWDRLLFAVIAAVVGVCGQGCASTASSSDDSAASDPSPREVRTASKTSSGSESSGPRRSVVVTLNNGPSFQGSIPSQVLLDTVVSLEDSVQRRPNDVGLVVTYLGLLRLQGQGGPVYDSVIQRAGEAGAKDPWFLIEASYGALSRKDYGRAEFFLAKAERLAKGSPEVEAAVRHGYGVSYLLQGRVQQAVFEMKRAADGSRAHLPSLLTLGFMATRFGDFEGAERSFRAAVSVASENVDARMGLAMALRLRGKASEALGIAKSAYGSAKNDRRVAWNYALVLSDIPGNEKEAMAVLERYFQMPGSLPDVDSRATQLLNTLQSRTQRDTKS